MINSYSYQYENDIYIHYLHLYKIGDSIPGGRRDDGDGGAEVTRIEVKLCCRRATAWTRFF
jgi:hypothetical protein